MAKAKPSKPRLPPGRERPNRLAVKKTISHDITSQAEQTRCKLYALFREERKRERIYHKTTVPSIKQPRSPTATTRKESYSHDNNLMFNILNGTGPKDYRYIAGLSDIPAISGGGMFADSPREYPSSMENDASSTRPSAWEQPTQPLTLSPAYPEYASQKPPPRIAGTSTDIDWMSRFDPRAPPAGAIPRQPSTPQRIIRPNAGMVSHNHNSHSASSANDLTSYSSSPSSTVYSFLALPARVSSIES